MHSDPQQSHQHIHFSGNPEVHNRSYENKINTYHPDLTNPFYIDLPEYFHLYLYVLLLTEVLHDPDNILHKKNLQITCQLTEGDFIE